MTSRLAELNKEMGRPDFWDSPQKAQAAGQEHTRLGERLGAWRRLES